MSNFPTLLTDEKIKDNSVDFRNALFSLDKKFITNDNLFHLTKIYFPIQLNILCEVII